MQSYKSETASKQFSVHLLRNNASIVYAYFEYSVHHTTSQYTGTHEPKLILVPTQLGSFIIKTENNITLGT